MNILAVPTVLGFNHVQTTSNRRTAAVILKAVEQAQVDPQEDFLQNVILWYRNRYKTWRNKETCDYGGNGRLGVTLSELEAPFERHFGLSGAALNDALNRMLEKRTLVLFYRRYEWQGKGYDRWRKLVEVKILHKLPNTQVGETVIRFYLPDALGRMVKTIYAKDVEVDRMIREILHPIPASAA